MIKQINHQNLLTTPFVAIKSWNLSNIDNNDLVLTESDNYTIAMEYSVYTGVEYIVNRDCNIALEQQQSDLVTFEEGISGSGLFDPTVEETNQNGSYKRLVYNQTLKSFYNSYQNPTQIFGLDNIDFPLSRQKRYLSNYFRMFTIPQKMFGDKMVEGTVQLFDATLDDNATIVDDSSGNVIAGNNLFSKIQEVRQFGSMPNIIMNGTASTTCSIS